MELNTKLKMNGSQLRMPSKDNCGNEHLDKHENSDTRLHWSESLQGYW